MMRWLFIVAIILSYLLFHELTHYAIFKVYDCEIDKYSWYYVKGICPNDDARLPQAINEIIGYNIMPFLVLFISIYIAKE